MTVGDLGRLRREFAEDVVGPHLQKVVFDVCKRIAWKYPPGRYTGRSGADRWEWGDDEVAGDFHDLASEVVSKLWEEEQVVWILEQAETISDARGLSVFTSSGHSPNVWKRRRWTTSAGGRRSS